MSAPLKRDIQIALMTDPLERAKARFAEAMRAPIVRAAVARSDEQPQDEQEWISERRAIRR